MVIIRQGGENNPNRSYHIEGEKIWAETRKPTRMSSRRNAFRN